jgi:hypothetical protein
MALAGILDEIGSDSIYDQMEALRGISDCALAQHARSVLRTAAASIPRRWRIADCWRVAD